MLSYDELLGKTVICSNLVAYNILNKHGALDEGLGNKKHRLAYFACICQGTIRKI